MHRRRPDDPYATAGNLERLGFTVSEWSLIAWNGESGRGPTVSTVVDGPQPDTRIVGVLVAPDGSAEVEDPDRKELQIELESTTWSPSHHGEC